MDATTNTDQAGTDPNASGVALQQDTGVNAQQEPTQLTSTATGDSLVQGAEASTTEAKPKPHKEGGATLVAGASAQPILLATVEVYRGEKGTFKTKLSTPAGADPLHTCDDADEVRGAVDTFLVEKLV